MRIGNAYRIVEEMKSRDERYCDLISEIESKIEEQKRLLYDLKIYYLAMSTNVELTKRELKALRVYLNNKYFSYHTWWRYGLSIRYEKGLFIAVFIENLI